MADTELTDLTAIAAVADEDLLYVVDDPSGSPSSRKATVTQLKTQLQSGFDADTVDGSHASAFATAAQGALADTASQPGHTHTEANITDLDHDAAKLQGVALDATVGTPSDGEILVYRTAGTDWVLEAKPAGGSNPALNDVTDVTVTSVADNEVLAYDNGTSEWINQTAAEASLATAAQGSLADSALQNVVEDTTPQLGGQLDVNGQALGDGTRELVTFTEDPSAVNHVNVENQATGGGPIISAAGDDTNVDLNLAGKGSGVVNASGSRVLTTADEGTGNGLDADTVDGNEASALLARANHTGTQAVSTLSDHNKAAHDALLIDADTVDGSHAAALLARANHTGTQTASTVSDFDTQVRTSRIDQMATPTASVAMGTQKLTGLAAGTTNGDSLRYEQLVGLYLLLAGGTMSGAIAMGSNKITGLAAATANGDALRYEQLIGQYLLLTGGTLSGNLAMGANKVTGLAAATANGDAVRYEQMVAVSINEQTGTTYTLVLADAGKLIRCNNASAFTLTVPPNSSVAFPTGCVINVSQAGAGKVTVSPGAGVTLNKPSTHQLSTATQYAQLTLVKTATDTWLVGGHMTAV